MNYIVFSKLTDETRNLKLSIIGKNLISNTR